MLGAVSLPFAKIRVGVQATRTGCTQETSMSLNRLASVAAVAALFALPLAGHAQQSAGTLMKDSAITAKIKAAQAADSTVRATSINVETDNNGGVTLSGSARSQAEIDRAVELAKGVQGVTRVTNNMTLAGGTAGTMGTTADNRTMTTERAPRADRN
jgi:hyperosmotically inducible periplasmic protein